MRATTPRSESYRLEPDSVQDMFQRSRTKIQIFGGGYANGKTTAMVIKGLLIARDYPGANILVARATYPKLMDTIVKVWFKWMPKTWQADYHKNPHPTLTLTNGTIVNFRAVSQTGKGSGSDTTSNLLSATYDAIIIDQIEDPEITEKDFLDLLGRLRGDASYSGDDPAMPLAGPRWFMVACNPTRNWVYRTLVRPLHRYAEGVRDPALLVDKHGVPIIELFEGSTYTNAANLNRTGDDYITTLESTYRGQMRDRYLLGKWAAYEGLVYPDFDEQMHVIPHDAIIEYMFELVRNDYQIEYVEGYDHGLRVPSCYLLSFVDHRGNMFVFDGVYEKECPISRMAEYIRATRSMYDLEPEEAIYADPSLFKRQVGTSSAVVGRSVATMFDEDELITLRPGNRDVVNGIAKVQSYLMPQRHKRHPLTQQQGAPSLYFSTKLDFVHNEFGDYYWHKESNGDDSDRPTDRNDHAMDTLKYMLSNRPPAAKLVIPAHKRTPGYMRWHEYAQQKQDPRKHRHV